MDNRKIDDVIKKFNMNDSYKTRLSTRIRDVIIKNDALGALVNLFYSVITLDTFLQKYINYLQNLTTVKNKALANEGKKILIEEYTLNLDRCSKNIVPLNDIKNLVSIIEKSDLNTNPSINTFLTECKYQISFYDIAKDYKETFNDFW